jgi:hypothetical protein
MSDFVPMAAIGIGAYLLWFGVHYWRDQSSTYPHNVIKSVVSGGGLPAPSTEASRAAATKAQLAGDQAAAVTDSGATAAAASTTGSTGSSTLSAATLAAINALDLTATAPSTSIGDGTNAQNTAAAYLDALGAPLTQANIESMIDWFEAEDDNQPTGGNATGVGGNDPLDLAAGYGDASSYVGVVGQNSAGGQALENLATPQDGAQDWAMAMTTGPYPGIVAALKAGTGLIGNSSLASEFLNYSGNGYDGLPAAYSGGTYS